MASKNEGDRVSESSATGPSSGDESANGEPKRLRLIPGQNQKQRSKLRQAPEAAPLPAPPPPTPAPAEQAPVIRKMRLKRSGQMREDLFLPEDTQPAKREDQY
ncbi:MAG TPA: hypothetical protein VF683_04490 [Chthoniobacterales bacterium]